MALLRAAGFKIVLHWMPNLLGATPDSDREDFPRLWEGLCPDEIKIYPTQLLENAPLYETWKRGEYQPYTTDELVQLIADVKPSIPRYCRVNRIIRDIPSTHVVSGNKRTSLRQDVQVEMARRGTHCDCIRCREVRGGKVEPPPCASMTWSITRMEPRSISCPSSPRRIRSPGSCGFRSQAGSRLSTGLADLDGAAIIREVHVYGQSLAVGSGTEWRGPAYRSRYAPAGEADSIARVKGYRRMAVIAAVGTRQYYLERGFERGDLYLVKSI